MRRLVVWPVAIVWTLAACRPSGRPPAPVDVTPTPAELRADLFAFADDSFRGRETGTPDADRAARFIADRLARLGVEPAGDSGFLQRVPMLRTSLGPATRFEVTTASDTTTLPVGTVAVPVPYVTPDLPLPAWEAEGDLVFGGYGGPVKGPPRDDLATLDVAGKAVVIVNGAPPGTDSATRRALESRAMIAGRVQQLLPRRPAAIILVLTGESAAVLPELARQMSRSRSVMVARPDSGERLPMIVFALASNASPILPDRWPVDDRPQPLAGRHFRGSVDIGFTGYNVVGVVRGRDTTLNRTFVAFGAHYDHIGVVHGAPAGSDSINNGADDDGTGTVTLLALARAFARGPHPRRSVLFVWHVGEEKGLLGSDYFTSHPTVPIDSIVAQINVDMVGRNAPDQLYVIGPLAAPRGQSRVLGAALDSVNASLPQPFTILDQYDRPQDPEQLYYRSDHFNYARKGIPILFFTTGLHSDYHRVSDEPDRIDYDKLAHVDQLLLRLGERVADRVDRPRP